MPENKNFRVRRLAYYHTLQCLGIRNGLALYQKVSSKKLRILKLWYPLHDRSQKIFIKSAREEEFQSEETCRLQWLGIISLVSAMDLYHLRMYHLKNSWYWTSIPIAWYITKEIYKICQRRRISYWGNVQTSVSWYHIISIMYGLVSSRKVSSKKHMILKLWYPLRDRSQKIFIKSAREGEFQSEETCRLQCLGIISLVSGMDLYHLRKYNLKNSGY
jgi:hypothetical protein